MKRMAVIAFNTFKENLRDKILYNLLFFGLLLIGSALLLGTLTMGEQQKIIKDIGLASINVIGLLVAVFVGIGLVSKELEKRTIFTIVSKPVPRYEFLLGRYAGLAFTLFVNVAIMTAGFFGTLLVSQALPDAGLLTAIGLMFMELLLIVAVAIMFSTFTTPTLSATFTLAIYVIGHCTADLHALGEKLHGGLSKWLINGLYYVLPNLACFNVKGAAAYGSPIEMRYVLTSLTYGAVYTAAVILVACMIFQRRDFR